MTKLSIKLVMGFITIMVISFIISFPITRFFGSSAMEDALKISQKSVAQSILQLNAQTQLTMNEIIHITSNFMYTAREVQHLDKNDVTQEQIDAINKGEIVFNFQPHRVSTVFKVADSYIIIDLNQENNLFENFMMYINFAVLLFIMIGCLVMIVTAKQVVKPIIALNLATKKVSKGNFDIQIDYNRRDEIGELTQNFNLMAKELNSMTYLRRDFISSVSHEFKTPLASISGFAKLLHQNNLSSEERKEYTEVIIEETARLSKLSSNILRLSKLENQAIIEQNVKFSLDEQIRKCVVLLENQWSKKDIFLNIDLERTYFIGDEELIQQVWINLLDNAIKFSLPHGAISIILYQTPSCITVRISDTGMGMNEETQKRLFEKFYQGDSSHASSGNGLGLSLVKRIIQLCEGSIHIESTPNTGSTFTIELPISNIKQR
jgi:signal transduction histidine kinase